MSGNGLEFAVFAVQLCGCAVEGDLLIPAQVHFVVSRDSNGIGSAGDIESQARRTMMSKYHSLHFHEFSILMADIAVSNPKPLFNTSCTLKGSDHVETREMLETTRGNQVMKPSKAQLFSCCEISISCTTYLSLTYPFIFSCSSN